MIDPQALYMQLGTLVAAAPDLSAPGPLPVEAHRWLSRAYALVAQLGDLQDKAVAKRLVDDMEQLIDRPAALRRLMPILYRSLATAELQAPHSAQGAFIPAGDALDALAAFAKVLADATTDVLMVDPYMDHKALTDYATLTAERVTVRLLSDRRSHKPSFPPAVQHWSTQYGAVRPLEARLSEAGTLHDRLVIIDGAKVWVLTQSLNAFAARSPASIIRVDHETATLKVRAYEEMWKTADAL